MYSTKPYCLMSDDENVTQIHNKLTVIVRTKFKEPSLPSPCLPLRLYHSSTVSPLNADSGIGMWAQATRSSAVNDFYGKARQRNNHWHQNLLLCKPNTYVLQRRCLSNAMPPWVNLGSQSSRWTGSSLNVTWPAMKVLWSSLPFAMKLLWHSGKICNIFSESM